MNVPEKPGRYNSPPIGTDFVLEVHINVQNGLDQKEYRIALLHYTDTKHARDNDYQVNNYFHFEWT